MRKVWIFLVSIIALTASGCSSVNGNDIVTQSLSEVEENPSSVSFSFIRKYNGGLILCPYFDISKLDSEANERAKGSGVNTSDESKQWIVYTSETSSSFSISRDTLDFCSSEQSISFTPGTVFYAAKDPSSLTPRWILKKK